MKGHDRDLTSGEQHLVYGTVTQWVIKDGYQVPV